MSLTTAKTKKDSWNEWANLVFDQLKRAETNHSTLHEELRLMESRIQEKLEVFMEKQVTIQLQVNELKTKAALLGAVVGGACGIIGSTLGTQIVSLIIKINQR